MKKLLMVLACVASLGLWMSCENESQELDVTLHSGVDTKNYSNRGTVTATKVTMVTTRGAEVTRDDNDKITNQPTDKKYYRDTVQTLSNDGKKVYKEYWFFNDWNAGETITFDMASVSWSDNVTYNTEYAANGSVGTETVSNAKSYTFAFSLINNNDALGNSVCIVKSGDVYQYGNNTNTYGTAKLDVKGNMEGNFTIGTLLKALDSNYSEEDEYGELRGFKYTRLDERTVYEERNGHYDSDSGEWVYEYVTRKIPANTSVYYLKDVSFTKN